jgi:hypothetical protein
MHRQTTCVTVSRVIRYRCSRRRSERSRGGDLAVHVADPSVHVADPSVHMAAISPFT